MRARTHTHHALHQVKVKLSPRFQLKRNFLRKMSQAPTQTRFGPLFTLHAFPP